MKINKLTALLGCLTILGLSVILSMGILLPAYISVSNTEKGLRNQFNAQNKNMEVVYDNTWKIIQQKAGVASEYKKSFAKIYPDLMAGRYGNARGGALMSWIQESNPEFSTKLYEDLSSSIEAQRNIFTHEQQKSIDIKREHDNLRTMFPTSLFVGGRPELELRLVTSQRTDEAFESGKDDNVKLFDNK